MKDTNTKQDSELIGATKVQRLQQQIIRDQECHNLQDETKQAFLEFYLQERSRVSLGSSRTSNFPDNQHWDNLFQAVFGRFPSGPKDPLWDELFHKDRNVFEAERWAQGESLRVIVRFHFLIRRLSSRFFQILTRRTADNVVHDSSAV